MTTIRDQVNKAIVECGMSKYRLSKLSGVSESALSRYLSGERDMGLGILEKLAPFIGVTITVKKTKKHKRQKRK